MGANDAAQRIAATPAERGGQQRAYVRDQSAGDALFPFGVSRLLRPDLQDVPLVTIG